jgi:hypothetical protein
MEDYAWTKLKDEELVKIRIKDLGLKLEGSEPATWINDVLGELKERGLEFKPRFYIGDEWFSPEGDAAVAIPFFLLHPRLKRLEKSLMYECEGESEKMFKRLLRHEMGHAFDHAFKTSRRKTWKKVFGSNKKHYDPETYRPRPYSKSFVSNIGQWYAQAHPDEDFAETFAVWLNTESNYEKRYKKWPAYKKLKYIEKITKEFKSRTNKEPNGRLVGDARYLSSTLTRYYNRKTKAFEEDYPKFFDKDLLRIFSEKSDETKKCEKASKFMRRNRKAIVNTTAYWTREKKVTIHAIFARLLKRCTELELVSCNTEVQTTGELSAYLATMVSNYLFTGHFKRRL